MFLFEAVKDLYTFKYRICVSSLSFTFIWNIFLKSKRTCCFFQRVCDSQFYVSRWLESVVDDHSTLYSFQPQFSFDILFLSISTYTEWSSVYVNSILRMNRTAGDDEEMPANETECRENLLWRETTWYSQEVMDCLHWSGACILMSLDLITFPTIKGKEELVLLQFCDYCVLWLLS